MNLFKSSYDDSRCRGRRSHRVDSTRSNENDPLVTCENLYWFPQFLNDVCPFKNEYNSEWKSHLIRRNSEAVMISINSKYRFTFYTPKIVKSVFNVCKMFRQPPEVRYLAIDVLDRFLVDHFFKVRQALQHKAEDEKLDAWEAIVERILKQSPLRVLTSVQLAMKYAWSTNVVTATDIQKVMEFLGQEEHYPKRSILKSEARVYQHLNYDIPGRTPFTYLEMFFDDFQKHEFFNIGIPLHSFFTTCINVLDVAIVFHRQIYNSLTGESTLDVVSLKGRKVTFSNFSKRGSRRPLSLLYTYILVIVSVTSVSVL